MEVSVLKFNADAVTPLSVIPPLSITVTAPALLIPGSVRATGALTGADTSMIKPLLLAVVMPELEKLGTPSTAFAPFDRAEIWVARLPTACEMALPSVWK